MNLKVSVIIGFTCLIQFGWAQKNSGVGTSQPNSKLEIRADDNLSTNSALNVTDNTGKSLLFVTNNGLIGVNNKTPWARLDIVGSARVISDNPQGAFGLQLMGVAGATNGVLDGPRLGGFMEFWNPNKKGVLCSHYSIFNMTGDASQYGNKLSIWAYPDTVVDISKMAGVVGNLWRERFSIWDNGDFTFHDTMGTAKVIVDKLGRVGIGVYRPPVYSPQYVPAIYPSAHLHISENDYASIYLGDNNVNGHHITHEDKTFNIWSGIITKGVNRFKIDENGNVGIGTRTPKNKFHVSGSTATYDNNGNVYDGDVAYFENKGFNNIFISGSSANELWSSMIIKNDNGIIFTDNDRNIESTNGFVIAPWSSLKTSNPSTLKGIRIDGPTGYLGVATATPKSTLDVSGTLGLKSKVISNSNQSIDDATVILLKFGTSASFVYQLPDPGSYPNRVYYFKNIQTPGGFGGGSGGSVTLQSEGVNIVTINPSQFCMITSDGSQWYLLFQQ